MKFFTIYKEPWHRLLPAIGVLILGTGIFVSPTAPADNPEPQRRRLVVDRVIAIVNDEVITTTDLQRSLLPLIRQLGTRFSGAELRQKVEEAHHMVLQQLIDNKLILHTARSMRGEEEYRVDEKDILEYMDRIISQFPSRQVFEESLKRENLSFEDFKKDSIDQILVKKLVGREVSSRVMVTNTDILKYYEDHPEQYQTPPKVRFAQIWLKTTPENLAEKKALMESILFQLEAGAEFENLARQYSEGPQAAAGGIWETSEKGKFTPEIDDVIWTLEPGQVSAVIDTRASLHLIKILHIERSRKIPVEEVWTAIENSLYYDRAEVVRKAWIEKLRSSAYIQINHESLFD